MAFTKINAAGIGTTETVTVDGLTVINDGSFGGNLTVSGVLTYEDVTNVDSVGLITARNGIVVGSGITLSKDGDIFATGITTVSGNVKVGTGITLSPDGDVFATGVTTATTFSGAFSGSGANITALNASNLASGTVPTARLGSGTASSSTFLRGDSTFAAVTSTTISNNADNRLITGTGTANTINAEANITFDGTSLNLLDHKNIYLGTGNDLRIWHDANNSYSQISGQNHSLYIDGATTYMRTSDGSSGVENAIVMNSNGSVDLYNSGTKKFETTSTGAKISGSGVTYLEINSTDGSVNPMVRQTNGDRTFDTGLRGDSSDAWCVYDVTASDNRFMIDTSGNVLIPNDSAELRIGAGADLLLYHDGSTNYIKSDNGSIAFRVANGNRIEINGSTGDVTMQGSGGKDFFWDNSTGYLNLKDNATLSVGTDNDLKIYHSGSHSFITDNGTGNLKIQGNATIILGDPTGSIDYAKFINGGYSEIYGNNTKRFETTSYGTKVFGYQSSSSYVGFHVVGTLSDHGFGTNHGSGITNFDIDYYSPIPMFGSKTIQSGSSYLSFPSYASGNYVKFTAPVAGLYQLELMASVETHHGGDWCAFGWELNTTTTSNDGNLANNGLGILAVYERAGGDEGMGCHFSTTIYMAANDYAVLYQQSTAAVRWKGNQYYVRGHLIH